MKTRNSTKSKLLSSVIALVLCVSMLIGATFAWFTDAASTGVNKIVAGNLDIGLQYKNDTQTDYADVTADTNVFKTDALWEPGHVEYAVLKISNLGTLALKYNFGIGVASETGSINVDGAKFKLSTYLKYAVLDGDRSNLGRDAMVAAATTTKNLAEATLDQGHMAAGADEKEVTLVVWMPSTVGNEANYKTGEAIPTIMLGINLTATQDTVEADSFNNQYDASAQAATITYVQAGANAEETKTNVTTAITAAKAGETVVLPKTEDSVKLSNATSGVTIKGDGTTKIDATGSGSIANIDGVTLEGLVIDCGQNSYHGFQHSDVTLKNCTINGLLFSYGTMVFENCTFINDKESGEYNMWAYGNVSYKNCTFRSYGKFVNVYQEGTDHFDVNFDGCTFINLKETGNKSAINVKDTCGAKQLNITVTINNCVYQGGAPEVTDTNTLKRYNSVVQLDDIGSGPSGIIIKQDGVTLWPANN